MSDFKVVYHITPTYNLENIKKHGLIPQIGEHSQMLGEKEKAVYLFKSKLVANIALLNWLGDLYLDADNLSMLKLKLPKSYLLDSPAGYEYRCTKAIPAKYITKITFIK